MNHGQCKPYELAIVPPEITFEHTVDTDCGCGPVWNEGVLCHRQMANREDLISQHGPEAAASDDYEVLFR